MLDEYITMVLYFLYQCVPGILTYNDILDYTNYRKLQGVQHSAALIFCCKRRCDYITQILQRLH